MTHPHDSSPNRRKYVAAIIAAASLVVVLGVVGFLILRSDSDSAQTDAQAGRTTPSMTGGSAPASVAPPKQIEVRKPIALDQPADFGTGLVVNVEDMKPVQSEARQLGDVAGPAVRVELVAENTADEPINLNGMQVALYYGAARTPGSPASGPNVEPFPNSIAPRGKASAAYVFRVPPDERDALRIELSYDINEPTIVLEGSLPK